MRQDHPRQCANNRCATVPTCLAVSRAQSKSGASRTTTSSVCGDIGRLERDGDDVHSSGKRDSSTGGGNASIPDATFATGGAMAPHSAGHNFVNAVPDGGGFHSRPAVPCVGSSTASR
jgi:hypothetical protein